MHMSKRSTHVWRSPDRLALHMFNACNQLNISELAVGIIIYIELAKVFIEGQYLV